MIKSEYLSVYEECLSLTPDELTEQAYNLVRDASRANDHWWDVLDEKQLLKVGYNTLQKNFGNLTDKEVISINEAMELTGYPRQSLVRLAKNDTHFIGEILEFVTTNPFVVYQSKRLADLMEQNNILLDKIYDAIIYTQVKQSAVNELTKVPPDSEISKHNTYPLPEKKLSTQEKLNAIKSKINIQSSDNAVQS